MMTKITVSVIIILPVGYSPACMRYVNNPSFFVNG